MDNQIKIFRPFSPAIGQYQMSQNMIDDINNYIDNIIKNKEIVKKQDHGSHLAGEVSQEIRIPDEFLKNGLLNFIAHCVKNYINFCEGEDIKHFNLINSWVVRQFKNEYNPIHWHSGHVSGVVYLKVPKNFGDSVQKNKIHNYNGEIVFIHGAKQFLSKSIISFTPSVGDVYIFPNYLMHMVYPFYAEGERRSLSFNGNIPEKV